MAGISSISYLNHANQINFQAKTTQFKNTTKIDELNDNEIKEDSLELRHQQGNYELTKEDKQQILHNAKTKAAGWSCLLAFGGATLYYGLRSNKKIAKNFDLDPVKDKLLIKQIRREQILATLPSALIPGLGGVAAYLYFRAENTDKIVVD